MTSVVVRSSANANAGAETKASTIIHGLLLLISVLSIAPFLNKIPLATLAAILLLIGYKLAVPNIKHFSKFMPSNINIFIVSLIAIKIANDNADKSITLIFAAISVIILINCIYKFYNDIEFKKLLTRNQYLYFPFIATVVAVVFTELLKAAKSEKTTFASIFVED